MYRCVTSVRMVKEGGRAVLLEVKRGAYYALDGVATSIWQGLANGKSVEEIVSDLEREYDVARTVLEKDVRAFLDDLFRTGMIECIGEDD